MGQRTSCCRKHSVYASFGKHVLFYFQMADYSIAGSGCHLYIKAGYQKSVRGHSSMESPVVFFACLSL